MFKKVLTFIIVVSFEMAVVYCASNSVLTHFLQGLLK